MTESREAAAPAASFLYSPRILSFARFLSRRTHPSLFSPAALSLSRFLPSSISPPLLFSAGFQEFEAELYNRD